MATTSDVVVIGGGVAGLSTAMQLAKRGRSVVVLERERIGNGSTGRAAGLVGQLRGTAEQTRMLMESVRIAQELAAETGRNIYIQTGSLRLAATAERAREIAALVIMGKSIGFQIDHLPIADVQEQWPAMKSDDLLDACFCPTDGSLQPSELVAAYMQVGRQLGVRYFERSRVEEVLFQGDRVSGVKTEQHEFHAPLLVNAAGPWSYLLADLVDAPLPATAVTHYRFTTPPDPNHPIDPRAPAIRDRHCRIYARPEQGGLIVGMYGEETTVCDMRLLPVDFDMSAMRMPDQEERVARLIEAAQRRFPWINERTPMRITPGIMTFTPDGHPLCGRLPIAEGLYHCTGFCGHGIAQSPMIGVIMAELIVDGVSSVDLPAIAADRYFDVPGFQSRTEIEPRCREMYAGYYGQVEGHGVRGG